MLDALIPACEAGLENANESLKEMASKMAEAALKGAESTAQMKSA